MTEQAEAPRSRHERRALASRRYGRDRRIAEILDVSRATVWRWARAGIIPAPIQISPGVTVWDLDAVERAIASRGQGSEVTP